MNRVVNYTIKKSAKNWLITKERGKVMATITNRGSDKSPLWMWKILAGYDMGFEKEHKNRATFPTPESAFHSLRVFLVRHDIHLRFVGKSESKRGGSRPGAGRKPGQCNDYGEATIPIRIPLSLVPKIREILDGHKKGGGK